MADRGPKTYNGTQLSAKKLRDLLPDFLEEIERKSGDIRPEVFRFWVHLLGETMAPMTEPVSLTDGVLTVKVKNGALYSVLCQQEKARLLKRLQEKFPIRSLIFRI